MSPRKYITLQNMHKCSNYN